MPLHSLARFQLLASSTSNQAVATSYRLEAQYLVRNHSLDFRRVGFADEGIPAQLAFALLVLRSQNVPQKSVRHLDLSCSRLLEALGGAFVCF